VVYTGSDGRVVTFNHLDLDDLTADPFLATNANGSPIYDH
jgi:hypothetical protein